MILLMIVLMVANLAWFILLGIYKREVKFMLGILEKQQDVLDVLTKDALNTKKDG